MAQCAVASTLAFLGHTQARFVVGFVVELALVGVIFLGVSRKAGKMAYQAGLAAVGVTMTVVFLFFTLSLLVGVSVNTVLNERRACGVRADKRHFATPPTPADVGSHSARGLHCVDG